MTKPVDPKAPTEETEPVRVQVPARRLSPAVIMLLVVAGVGLIGARAVIMIAAGMIVANR